MRSLAIWLAGAVIAGAQSILDVGDRRQLLIDERFFDSRAGVTLEVHPPYKTGELNLQPDRPWEDALQAGTVMHRDGVYHLWYVTMEKRFEQADDFDGVRIAYARSADGIRWEKPELGLTEFRGSRANNIVLGYGAGGVPAGIAGGMVFIDPNATAAQRYVMATRSDSVGPGLHLFASPDGIRWSLKHRSVITWTGEQAHLDTKNVVLWDPRIQRYTAYVRKNLRVGGNPEATGVKASWNAERGARIRVVARGESKTLVRFPPVEEMQVVFGIDGLDPAFFDSRIGRRIPYYDYYTAETLIYPWADDAYFLFPSGYYHYHPEIHREFAADYPRNAGVLDIRFAASRDGIEWKRYDREPFVRLGMKGEFDSKRGYMVHGVVPGANDGELYLYYMGTDQAHGWDRDERNNRLLTAAGLNPGPDIRAFSRLVLRRDGFVSARGAYTGGEFTTPPLRFAGDELVLNVDTSAAGEVRVEVLDAESQPLPGFQLEECDRIHSSNEINRVVTWNGRRNVSAVEGRLIRLRFTLRDADIYAFQFRRAAPR